MIVIMNLICRTCMRGNKKCVNIFDYRENGKMLSDMLVEFARIKVQENDGLPLYICNCCLKKLITAWDFRVMIIEADSTLRDCFSNYGNESVVQNNILFVDMTLVKEECNNTVETEIPTSLLPDNSSWPEDALEKNGSASIHNHTVSLRDKSKQLKADKSFIKKSVEKDPSNKSIQIFTCENDNVIPKIMAKNSENKGEITSTSSGTDNEMEIAFSLKQGSRSNIFNFTDCGYENLIDKNISGNHVSDENNAITEIPSIEIKMQDDIIQNTSSENSIVNEDEMLEDDCQYKSDKFINNSDISTGNINVELSSEKTNKKSINKEKNQMPVFCKLCNKSFGYRYYFEVHVKDHNGDKKWICNICGKAFVRQYLLRLHMAVHSNDRPFPCETCGKTFKYQGQLRAHKILHSDGILHACSICQKTFKTKNSLGAHFRRHKNDRRFTCEVCGKSFNDPSTLSKHRLTHDGKKFPCPTCGKAFSRSSHMRSHLESVHSEARPHLCSYCGKSFKTKDVLDTHILIHTGEKPYSCKICNKSFRQSSALYKHMRIHTGETPYACELCPSHFKYSQHLQNHMKVHK